MTFNFSPSSFHLWEKNLIEKIECHLKIDMGLQILRKPFQYS